MVGHILVAVQAIAIACRDWIREELRAWQRAGEFLARIEQLDAENMAAYGHADMN